MFYQCCGSSLGKMGISQKGVQRIFMQNLSKMCSEDSFLVVDIWLLIDHCLPRKEMMNRPYGEGWGYWGGGKRWAAGPVNLTILPHLSFHPCPNPYPRLLNPTLNSMSWSRPSKCYLAIAKSFWPNYLVKYWHAKTQMPSQKFQIPKSSNNNACFSFF